jgi:hypothetical protein
LDPLGAANDIDSDFLKVSISGMSRRRRRKEPDLMDLVPPVAGLLLLAILFVPGFRALLGGIVIVGLIMVGVVLGALIAWKIYRHYHSPPAIDRPSVPRAPLSLSPPIIESLSPGAAGSPALGVQDERIPKSSERLFTRELLDSLEWRRFEQLVTWYFQRTGFRAERSRIGADGGVDILLFRQNEERPFAYVQCKAWHTYDVGVKPVRELFGVMAAEKISTGYFVTTGCFTSEALEFAQGKPLKLVTGDYLLERLNSLAEAARSELLHDATYGDYATPTCPRCDVKMVLRHGPTGDFWGCPNFRLRWPKRCKQTFKLRAKETS